MINPESVTIEDCKIIKEFIELFNEHLDSHASERLISALNSFIEDAQSNRKEQEVRVELCRWFLLSADNAIFQDEIWDKFKEKANKIAYNIEFDINTEDAFKVSF